LTDPSDDACVDLGGAQRRSLVVGVTLFAVRRCKKLPQVPTFVRLSGPGFATG
jgi:hypothetical protein